MPDRMAGRHLSIAFDFRICITFSHSGYFPQKYANFRGSGAPGPIFVRASLYLKFLGLIPKCFLKQVEKGVRSEPCHLGDFVQRKLSFADQLGRAVQSVYAQEIVRGLSRQLLDLPIEAGAAETEVFS